MTKEQWHLDRKVTLGLIVAIVFNAASSIWWAASLNAQVINQQKTMDTYGSQISALALSQSGVGERLAKMEEGISYQTKALDRIEQKIEKGGK